MKKNHCRKNYGEVLDDEGYAIFRVYCVDDSEVDKVLDDCINDTRENVRATNIDSLIDTSRKRRKKDE